MMEEAADDVNGDSTFEFVAVKDAVTNPDSTETKSEDGSAASVERVPQAALPTPPAVTSVPATFQPVMPPQTVTQSQAPLRPVTSPFQHSYLLSSMRPPQVSMATEVAPMPVPYTSPFPPPSPTQPAGQTPPVPAGVQHPPPQQPPPPQQYYASQPSYPYHGYSGSGDQSFSVSLPTDYEHGLLPTPSSSSSSGNNSMWGWFKGNEFLNKVAEKAKNSVDSMITTLDPGMKEFIYSGGDIDILVASHDDIRVIGPVREAFQKIFGRATVTGITMPPSNMAPQPVGFAAGLKAAEDKITSLQQTGRVPAAQAILAVESFIVELTPESWFDMHCLVLKDDPNGLFLHTFGQATPVPAEFIAEIQDRTPADYPLRWCGLAVTVGEVASPRLVVPQSEWRAVLCGVPDTHLVCSAACALASMYRRALRR
uniref:Putative rna polymerase ii c-terminal domain-binding protein ra4 n=1 Tax=Amblyomma triste TaxID=251400 RepID=A0A023GCL7_AMBTT